MGLDNIPREYPCKKQGIASVNHEGKIDCDKTQSLGNCPWKNEFEANPLLKEARPTYGMLGTSCWYRGKYGNFLLGLLEGNPDAYADTKYSFYGEGIENGDGTYDEGMSVDYCLDMASYMENNTEQFAHKAKDYALTQNEIHDEDVYEKDLIKDWIYATWWTKFAAEYCDGSTIWY